MSDADLTQMWASVFRARGTLNDVRLGARPVPDDLLRVIEELLAVVERLRCSYDAQYSQLWEARDLLREVTGAAPVDDPRDGQDWHAVSHDLVRRAAKFLLSTEQPDSGV